MRSLYGGNSLFVGNYDSSNYVGKLALDNTGTYNDKVLYRGCAWTGNLICGIFLASLYSVSATSGGGNGFRCTSSLAAVSH